MSHAIASVLRQAVLSRPERILAAEDVELALARLSTRPRLVETTLALLSVGEVVRILRALLAEHVSVLDLPAVLEAAIAVLVDERAGLEKHREATGASRAECHVDRMRQHDLLWQTVAGQHRDPQGRVKTIALEPGERGEQTRRQLWLEILSTWTPGHVVLAPSSVERRILRQSLNGALNEVPIIAQDELGMDPHRDDDLQGPRRSGPSGARKGRSAP